MNLFADRDPIAVAFGRVLRTARGEADLTRDEVAAALAATLNYPRFFYRSVEMGFSSPNIPELFAIARIFKTHPAKLMRRTVLALSDGDAKEES